MVLTGLPDEEVRFHAIAVYATGGMILSGDDLSKVGPATMEMQRRLLPPTGRAARFQDASLGVGTVDHDGARAVCLLNWEDTPRTLSFVLERRHRVRELWSGEDLGLRAAGDVSMALPPRSGRVLICTPTG